MRKGEDNLIPLPKRTKEKQREIRVMGGKASGEARRAKRSIRQLLEAINNEDVEVLMSGKPVKTIRKMKALLALQTKAEEGDVVAIREWAKLLGEYEDKVCVEAEVSSETSVNLTIKDIDPEALAQFIVDAQR